MKRFFLPNLLLLTLAFCHDASGQGCSVVDQAALKTTIEHLASAELAGRRGIHSRRAAEFIEQQFQQIGLEPAFANQSWLQSIPGQPTAQGESTFIGKNVAGILRGSDPALKDEYLLLAAHHDHLGTSKAGIFHGADDNASGVAMLLEVARLLASEPQPPRRSILFVSFDLEEHLLFGSRWFAAHPPVSLKQLKFVVVADMLGRSLGDMPLDAAFFFGSEHGSGIRELVKLAGNDSPVRPILLSDDFVGTRSDYGPFRDRQIPFLFVSTGQSRDYHTVRDTADKINIPQVAAITDQLAKLLKQLANADSAPAWIDEPELQLDEVRDLLDVVNTIQTHAVRWNLTAVQQLFITQTANQARKILKNGQITASDRAWLTRTTQLLLLSVF